MSESEKTHIVVILLAVFGGFVFLGCIVFAGLSFFVVGGSSDSSMIPVPQATATNSSVARPIPSIVVRSLSKQEDGSFLVTLADSINQLQAVDRYELKDLSWDNADITVVKLKRDPKGPLSQAILTVLKISPKKGATALTLSFRRHATGPDMDQSFPGVLKIDLTKTIAPANPKRESLKAKDPEAK
ncbi:MAG: hypothetical protein P1V97_02570 [Planctomycetota bacterium]|nr:hypothetical protein [Planctomycetota bacterium]